LRPEEEMTPLESSEEACAEEAAVKIATLLRKASGWVLVGFALLPGWVSHPLAFKYATDALKVYRDAAIDDGAIHARIQRIRVFTGLLSVVYWGITVFYLFTSR
jgi:hypothetical protein